MARERVTSTKGRIWNLIGVTDKDGFKNPTKIKGFFKGTYLDSRPNIYDPGKPTQIHVFQTALGEQEVYGKTALNNALAKIKRGTYVWVEYTGMEPGKNKGTKRHAFLVDQDRNITDPTAVLEVSISNSHTESEDEPTAMTYTKDSDELDEEDASQAKALAVLEQKAKVEALLRGKKTVRN